MNARLFALQILVLFGFNLLANRTLSQTNYYKELNKSLKKIVQTGSHEGWLEIVPEQNISPGHFLEKYEDELGLGLNDRFELTSEFEYLGKSYFKYSRYYSDLEVIPGEILFQYEDGFLVSVIGYFHPIDPFDGLLGLDALGIRSLEKVSEDLEISIDKLKIDESSIHLDFEDPNIPLKERSIVPVFDAKISLREDNGWDSELYMQEVLLNAASADLVSIIPMKSSCQNGPSCGTGNANTGIHGWQEIETKPFGSNDYMLLDCKRNVLTQYCWDVPLGGSCTTAVDVLNTQPAPTNSGCWWTTCGSNNSWTCEWPASIHWYTEMYNDYLCEQFNRDSYDGLGSLMESRIGLTGNQFAAYANGIAYYHVYNSQITEYPSISTPAVFSSIDLVGHEWAHGVEETTIYNLPQGNNWESRSIIEGVCDVFGETGEQYTEYIYTPEKTCDWTVAEDLFDPISGQSWLRSIKDPETVAGHTKCYKDNNLIWDININQTSLGYHKNSGVTSYWFYLLSEGGYGTNNRINDARDYRVDGIGKEKALDILYATLNGNFPTLTQPLIDFRAATIQIANSLYGSCSYESTQVMEAWNAVGVYTNCTFSNINVTTNPATCAGAYNGSATISAQSSCSSNLVYVWDNGSIGSSVSNLQSGEHTVWICAGTDVKSVMVYIPHQSIQTWPVTSTTSILYNNANDISIDKYGDTYIIGEFSEDSYIQGAQLINTPPGIKTLYYASIDACGNINWAHPIQATTDVVLGRIISTNSDLYITGYAGSDGAYLDPMGNNLYIGPGPFLASLNPATGIAVSAHSFPAITGSQIGFPHEIMDLNAQGSMLYVCGTDGSNGWFARLNPAQINTALFIDYYYSSGSPNQGNTFNQIETRINNIAVTEVAVIGTFFSQISLGASTFNCSSSDAVLAYFDELPNPVLRWAEQANSTVDAEGISITTDNKGYIYPVCNFNASLASPWGSSSTFLTNSEAIGISKIQVLYGEHAHTETIDELTGAPGSFVRGVSIKSNGSDLFVAGNIKSADVEFPGSFLYSGGSGSYIIPFVAKLEGWGQNSPLTQWLSHPTSISGGTAEIRGMTYQDQIVHTHGDFQGMVDFPVLGTITSTVNESYVIRINDNPSYAVSPGDNFRIASIRELDQPNTLSVFPNPGNARIQIESNFSDRIEIKDVLGRIVFRSDIEMDEPLTIDVSSWSPGSYVVYSASSIVQPQKWIKND